MTNGFIKRGNLDTHVQRKDDVKIQEEDSHCQAKERGQKQILPSQGLTRNLDLRLVAAIL